MEGIKSLGGADQALTVRLKSTSSRSTLFLHSLMISEIYHYSQPAVIVQALSKRKVILPGYLIPRDHKKRLHSPKRGKLEGEGSPYHHSSLIHFDTFIVTDPPAPVKHLKHLKHLLLQWPIMKHLKQIMFHRVSFPSRGLRHMYPIPPTLLSPFQLVRDSCSTIGVRCGLASMAYMSV